MPSQQATAQLQPGWRMPGWLSLVLLGAALLSVYGLVLYQLGLAWFTNDDMSHGPFVPVLAAYVLLHRWSRLTQTPRDPSLVGLLVMILGMLMLTVGPPGLATFTIVTRLAFLVSLTGVVLYVGGWGLLRQLLYPIGLLILMIPLPSFLLGPMTLKLQMLASRLAETVLDALGYSILRQGNIIQIPGQVLSIAEACSGLRSLFSLSFLAQVYIYVLNGGPWMRLAVAVMVIPIAILANAGRIVLTAYMGTFNRDLVHGDPHAYTGWAVFAVSFTAIILGHQLLKLILPKRFHLGQW